ncbi:hypothetical protein HNR12_001880 [Streptomonospora nanhaiensis]|uniref:Uncharacterized protein n=1 Tax=Streptomonospora nanhaiensis TaxID=1323731 RepID=A0A853BK06_9ACTN|nr:hypothetical protein [Streptomonospora nanhaiensis]NYI95603.1 hypothetical protein [Streptomonospora nanhaiensis]
MVEFVRAWIIGAVSWFMLTNIGALAFRLLAPPEHAGSFGWALLWLGGIGFAAYFLTVVATALVHRAPDRHDLGRNALAVLLAPLVGTAIDTGRLLAGTGVNWPLYGSWTAIALVGAVLAFLLMRRLQRPAVVEAETGDRVPKTYWDRTDAGSAEEHAPAPESEAPSGTEKEQDADSAQRQTEQTPDSASAPD